MKPNVRLLPNVMGIVAHEEAMTLGELVKRLGYFELLSYRRVNPVLFTIPGYDWTERQRRELEGPRARSGGYFEPLWALCRHLDPVPATRVLNPFEVNRTELKHRTQIPPAPDLPAAPSNLFNEILVPEPLEDEQRSVIEGAPRQDMLVVAPPGTGKTHVLVERLAWLAANGYMENALAESLVLSFTRSAVGELTLRLKDKAQKTGCKQLPYCRVSTFDAFATELINKDLQREQLERGYENRIRQFTSLLRNGLLVSAKEQLSQVRS